MEQEIQKLQERLAKAKDVFREMTAKDKEKDARIAELEAQLAEAVHSFFKNLI
jgi:septal ring factor EnvC (AmiA/AmiB activator)